MKRRFALLLSGAALYAPPVLAQATLPLPGGRPAPTAPPPAAAQTTLPLPGPATPAPVAPPQSSPINPYNRDVELTVPLLYRNQELGDIPVLITRDGHFFVNRAAFERLIDSLLNDVGKTRLANKLGQIERFSPEDLAGTGLALQYDPNTLAIVILSIEPTDRLPERLFEPPSKKREQPDIQPAKFSGYVNFAISQNYEWRGNRNLGPSAFISGALRWGPVVFEGEGSLSQGQGQLSTNRYGFERSFARLVYDQPEDYRRWELGDLTPDIRGQQGYSQLGGFGVTRQRNRFDPTRTAILQANRQIVLKQDATVSIYRNGSLFKQEKLPAGVYDLSSLPLSTGSNDVRVDIRDDAGRVQSLSYSSYLDPIDLVPGDYEYSANIGFVGDQLSSQPHYTRDIAFTGYYRKALLNLPAFGIGLQASKKTQQVIGQTQYLLPNGGRIQMDFGASHVRTRGMGYSAMLGYDQLFDRGGLVDSAAVRVYYQSRYFGGLGNSLPDNSNALTVDAQYSRAFNIKLLGSITGSYIKGRGGVGDTYRIGASASYRINPRWGLRAGVNYARFSDRFARQRGVGAFLSLVYQPNYRSRAEARYDSGTDMASVSYDRSGTGRIGSLGYGAVAERDPDNVSFSGYAEYTANRFDLSASQSTYGTGFSSLGKAQVTTVRVGTAIAFADGKLAVSRPITDSFAIVYPYKTLKGRSVVAGQSVADNDYISKSDFLGGAVNNYLTSYADQSVTYDVKDPPAGYDLGPGIYRVRPTYRSGYVIRVGTDAFVSATGTLLQSDGSPIVLAVGLVREAGTTDGGQPFFTNSNGRFAITGLKPGKKYQVVLRDGAGEIQIVVPSDTTGLVTLDKIKLAPPGDSQ